MQRQPQTYINKCTWLCFNRTLFEKPGSRSELAMGHSLPASDLEADRAWPRDWHTSQATDTLKTGCCIFSQSAWWLLLGKDAWRFLISILGPCWEEKANQELLKFCLRGPLWEDTRTPTGRLLWKEFSECKNVKRVCKRWVKRLWERKKKFTY